MLKSITPLFVCLFIFSCSKNENKSCISHDNSFVANRNNLAWKGTTEINLTMNDTLVFFAIGEGLDNGVLVGKIKFDGVGSYKLNGRQGIYYNTIGGDVLISQYEIKQGFEGTISITSFEKDDKCIEGSFEVPLKATRLNSSNNIDTTITISNGRFKGFIGEEILQD